MQKTPQPDPQAKALLHEVIEHADYIGRRSGTVFLLVSIEETAFNMLQEWDTESDLEADRSDNEPAAFEVGAQGPLPSGKRPKHFITREESQRHHARWLKVLSNRRARYDGRL